MLRSRRQALLLALLVAVGAAAFLTGPAPLVSSAGAQGPDRVAVLIAFTATPGPAEQALVRSVGGQIRHSYHLVPAIAASIPQQAVAALLANPRVTAVEPDGEVFALDAELDNTWGVKRIGAGDLHAAGNTGAGVRVAVIDSGIDYNHPDLSANYAGGRDFVNDDDYPMDDNGHGTHVAGTIAALDNGTGVVGAAPAVFLYALKVLNAQGSGSFSGVIAALQWAVDHGIQVTNNSYGSSQNPGGIVETAFINAEAVGVFHAAAAGNSGTCAGKKNSVEYPARFASVVAVAATTQSDASPCFSSTGPEVELSGPGVDINSTLRGGGYGTLTGTSMASPHVAGSAALVIAAGVSDQNANGRVNDEVRQLLQDTAQDLGSAGRDTWFGFGLVRADLAVAAIGSPAPVNDAPTVTITEPANGASFASGEPISFSGTASDTEDGDVTAGLVWTSSLNGQIGTGSGFSTSLPDGDHTITAAVTDSGGKSGSASVTITVGAPPPPAASTVSVASVTYAGYGGPAGNRHFDVTVAVADNAGNPVAGATVSVIVTRDGAFYGAANGVTGGDGKAVFTAKNAPLGCYATEVAAVIAGTLTWDGNTPANSFCK